MSCRSSTWAPPASGAPDTSCDNTLSDVVENLLKISGMSQVRNGRFKGGWITRHYSNIAGGVHSLQMELACRGYMHEPLPDQVDEHSWPTRSTPTTPHRCATPWRRCSTPALNSLRTGAPHDPQRPVRTLAAPTGTTLNAKSWLTEAPLRMLMNNLHPDVAERPQELVVYGGIGRAARDWESFDAIVETLKRLDDDQTLLVQSGKPVGVFRTHRCTARADRQFQPGAALGQLGPLQRTG